MLLHLHVSLLNFQLLQQFLKVHVQQLSLWTQGLCALHAIAMHVMLILINTKMLRLLYLLDLAKALLGLVAATVRGHCTLLAPSLSYVTLLDAICISDEQH